jgi:hypothetical protein
MTDKRVLGGGVLLAAIGGVALAQAPLRLGPPPGGTVSYRVSASTYSGFGAQFMGLKPTIGGMFGALTRGSQADAQAHLLTLELGSNRPVQGAPQAEHVPPPGLGAGPTLPLVTPEPVTTGSNPDRSEPSDPGQPRGRILLFWGCSEVARPGQPFVIDLAKLGTAGLTGQTQTYVEIARRMQAMRGGMGRGAMGAAGQRGFARASYRTIGEWPNSRTKQQVPATGSLVGEHIVRGSYSPEIRWTMAPGQDFLGPIRVSRNGPLPSGAVGFDWSPIPNALAFSAFAFGGGEDTIVLWTSSDTQSGGDPGEFASESEVARLVQARALMAPTTTHCAIPAEAIKAMGQGGMLFMTAYGPTYSFSYPPKPPKALASWAPDWTTRIATRASWVGFAGRELPGLGGEERGRGNDGQPDKPKRKKGILGGLPIPF